MQEEKYWEFYKNVLNKVNSNIYITDIETDEIIYMNDYMKKTFHLGDVEGKVCWKVLQTGMTQRCEFCKIDELKKKEQGACCVWEEQNTITGRTYSNYDTLETVGDRTYHVQNSVDVTEYLQLSMEATIDNLTGVLNRSAGKNQLEQELKEMKKGDKLTVALCDLNGLKWVNDTYGHMEGDRFLVFIARTIQSRLEESDFVFRLSGDEFVVVFKDKDISEADQWMEETLESLDEERKVSEFNYEVTFSYGFAPVSEYENLTVSDVLSIADSQMYMQKRDNRIIRDRRRLYEHQQKEQGQRSFQYNKDYLFDILSDCVDDYVFVGNLKTGRFMYSYKMMLDFGLPSQVLDNAAAFWGEKIHPDDAEMFLKSNQEIADGRADHHTIIYRAKNVKDQWIHLMCKGQMVRDVQGQPELFAGIIRNLDSKAANSNEELRVISDSSTDGIFKAALTEGFPVLYANDGYYEIHGYTRKQMAEEINNHAAHLVYEEDIERVEKELAESIEKKEARTVLEYRIRKRDGSIAWVHVNAGVTHLQDGPLVLIGMIMDITERRELEIRLQRTEQLFKIARKYTRLSMWEFDIQNKRIIQTEESRMTHGFGEIIDNVPETLIESQYVHPESIEEICQMYKRLEEGEGIVTAEVRVKTRGKENSYWWEKITYTITQWDHGEPVWAVGVSEDVTARREAEIRVFQEETMRELLTEDLLLSFRVNMDQNCLEELWDHTEEKIEKDFTEEGYTDIYDRICEVIANDSDRLRLQTYYAPEKIEKLIADGENIPDFEFRYKQKDGRIIWAVLNMKVIVSPEIRERILFGYIKNIDFLKKNELSLQKKAEIDEVSGFYNASTAELLIREMMKNSLKKKDDCLLMLLDVDHFGDINRKGGYLAGDQILYELSCELDKSVAPFWVKSRISGDVFLLFGCEMPKEEMIAEKIEEIRKNLCRNYRVGDQEFAVTLSVGGFVRVSEDMTYDQIYYYAQHALNKAKRNGGNQLVLYNDTKRPDTVMGSVSIPNAYIELQEKYEYALGHDEKTGLLNYHSYVNYLQNANEDVHSAFGIVGIQMAELKNYNQKYGIQAGDKILQFLAEVLIEVYGKDLSYRVSGAGFRVLCPDTAYENFIDRFQILGRKVEDKYRDLFVFSNVWEQSAILLERMEDQVDEKLQVARISKRNKTMSESEQTVAEVLESIQETMQQGNFRTFFQPKARADTGKICGAEALIRCYDPEKGIIPPGRFLPAIEQAGLVRYIDLFVLEEVCRTIRNWLDSGWEPFPVSLNYSRTTILEPGILEETERIVQKAGIPKNLIEIEVTESIGSIDSVGLKEITNKFVENGYKIALDDFGAEYSNIYVLYSLALNSLKLDRRIIGDIYHDKRARLVVESVIDMCGKLGITSVAEGVETEEQLRVLQEMSCDVIQGYYLNKPLPEKEFYTQYIKKNNV